MHCYFGDLQFDYFLRSTKTEWKTSIPVQVPPQARWKCETILQTPQEKLAFLLDETCEQDFLAFKKTIATLRILSRPRPGVPLLLYLSVADEVVSSALIQEEGKHQLPIYFTSRILHDAEKHYQMIEKVTLALITSARRLRPYFQSHQVVVKTNDNMVHQTFKNRPSLRTTRPHGDIIHGWLSGRICRKW